MRLTVRLNAIELSAALAALTLIVLSGCRREPEPAWLPATNNAQPTANAARPQQPAQPVQPAQPAEPEPQEQALPPAQVVEGDSRAPDTYTARLVTTKGNIDIEVHRDWAPHGADRFYTLIREGFFTDVAFFRVIEGFMAQGGIHGDPQVAGRWRNRRIPDDPVREHNRRGYVTFAMAGPNSRTTQFFINLVDNSRLDSMGFAPFGRVRDMAVVDRIHSGYGESAPRGRGPVQGRLQSEGNRYLRADFPDLDYIRSASIVER